MPTLKQSGQYIDFKPKPGALKLGERYDCIIDMSGLTGIVSLKDFAFSFNVEHRETRFETANDTLDEVYTLEQLVALGLEIPQCPKEYQEYVENIPEGIEDGFSPISEHIAMPAFTASTCYPKEGNKKSPSILGFFQLVLKDSYSAGVSAGISAAGTSIAGAAGMLFSIC